MSIVIDDLRLGQLAWELADAEGTMLESVVRESLMSCRTPRVDGGL